MKTFTMNKFDFNEAWKSRNEVLNYVKVGTKLLVDGKRELEVTEIKADTRENYQSHFIIKPINETLKSDQRSFDIFAKNNSRYYTVGEYPDFLTEIESIWFFSRNVQIIQEVA